MLHFIKLLFGDLFQVTCPPVRAMPMAPVSGDFAATAMRLEQAAPVAVMGPTAKMRRLAGSRVEVPGFSSS